MSETDRPSGFPWPPVITLAGIAAMVALGRLVPMEPSPRLLQPVGVVLVVLALAVDLWVLMIFRRHKTTIRPDRGASHLVTTGPFSVSRNPIYVANLALLLGVGMATRNIWAVPAIGAVFLLIDRLAAAPEERHLAALFGRDFEDYRQRVRRWL
ncbi:MAG: isoprenylcysteine carboxylmethyltransferase family protein [Pseudomonadota bacterium]